ncbi:MAG: CRISPR-associated protein Cas5 [Aridibacter sp.]
MKGFLLNIKGNWAHFRKPETNNNPLTHDFITKTALLGMIGAVLGIERNEMARLFPQLSEDFLYGVLIKNEVKKESWGFTLRYVVDFFQKAPKQMEFLKHPEFKIALALKNEQNTESKKIFDSFQTAIEDRETKFTPVLGLHNCPAELSFDSGGEFQSKSGDFVTQAFVTEKHEIDTAKLLKRELESKGFRLGIENMPTFQNDDFWNPPEKYVRVIYPSEGNEIYASGEYFQFTDQSQWTLI